VNVSETELLDSIKQSPHTATELDAHSTTSNKSVITHSAFLRIDMPTFPEFLTNFAQQCPSSTVNTVKHLNEPVTS